nr:uncharacterized protein LOC123768902 [Procambarus clarkii]
MGEKEAVPFFTSLLSLGHYVDEQVSHLKEEMSFPAGQKPHIYDIGLRKFKKEVQELKNLSNEVNQNLKVVTNFSGYLESMQEHLNQQATDICKMERYLAKFGYVPLQTQVSEEQNAVKEKKEGLSIKQTLVTEDSQKSEEKPVSSSLVAEKSKDQVNISVPVIAQSNIGVKNTQPTNSRDGARLSVSLASLSRSHVTVDQWLAGIEESGNVTPDVLRKTSIRKKLLHPPVMEAGKSYQSSDGDKLQLETGLAVPHITDHKSKDTNLQIPTDPQFISVPKDSCCEYTPPCEPQFSEYTMQVLMMKPILGKKEESKNDIAEDTVSAAELKIACSVTPEEPGLSLFSSVKPQLTVASNEISTPEEPILPFQDYQASKRVVNTPEEPVLPNHQQRHLHSQREMMFEESAATIHKEKPVEQDVDKLKGVQKYHREFPCSPELSEITRSILSLTLQPQKDLYNTKSCHEQLRNQPISSSSNSKNIEHGPLERSISDNAYERKLLSRHSQDVTHPSELDQTSKMRWHHLGVSMEHFLNNDKLPLSPQLSDITQKIIGQIKK